MLKYKHTHVCIHSCMHTRTNTHILVYTSTHRHSCSYTQIPSPPQQSRKRNIRKFSATKKFTFYGFSSSKLVFAHA